MALMLLQHNATVTICTSKTVDLAKYTRDADILVVATAGKDDHRRHDQTRAAVIDVGITACRTASCAAMWISIPRKK